MSLRSTHAAEHGELGNRRPQQAEQIAESAAIERDGIKGAPLQYGTVEFAQVIGVLRERPELQVGMLLDIVDRLAAAFEKDAAQFGVRACTDGVGQKCLGCFNRIVRRNAGALPRAGYPGGAGRPGRGAADKCGSLDQQHASPFECRHQRRRHAGAAGADHDEVVAHANRGDIVEVEQHGGCMV